MRTAGTRWIGRAALVVALGATPLAFPTQAQDFGPVVTVNNRMVTGYELDQRIQFLTLLGQDGDVADIALKGLIEDRLRQEGAEIAGVTLSPEAVTAAMGEFAGRANLSLEEFVAALAENGVDVETFRDFVASGLSWREAVRGRFGPTVQITDTEVDRAITEGAAAGGEVKVLLSEIVIATGGAGASAASLAEKIRSEVKSPEAFAGAARRYSVSDSKARGGQIEWLLQSALPPAVAVALEGLEVGQISPPVEAPGQIILFYLRDVSMTPGDAPYAMQSDFAEVRLPRGAFPDAEVAVIRAGLRNCLDLYPLTRRLGLAPPERATRGDGELPSDLALELARLDAGETSARLQTAEVTRLLMLCNRIPATEVPASREDVRDLLRSQRLAALAGAWLEELRSEAIIRTP